MLFDWLVVGQVVPLNPAAVLRGPRHSVSKGKTPVLTPEKARLLLDSLPTDAIAGLRDRAIGQQLLVPLILGRACASHERDQQTQVGASAEGAVAGSRQDGDTRLGIVPEVDPCLT